ncbi:MAG: hypothetical protein JWQ08_1019, partial [Deinococcus sp.]|nr:hypothetical protein [Deinococcus sp.]
MHREGTRAGQRGAVLSLLMWAASIAGGISGGAAGQTTPQTDRPVANGGVLQSADLETRV